jgi:mRNA interferase HigB
MRIIKGKVLRDFITAHPAAELGLCHWFDVVQKVTWRSPDDVKATFAHADLVKVASGETVVVFNVSGGHYRLIAAIHYNKEIVFTLLVLTHAEYGTNRCRRDL